MLAGAGLVFLLVLAALGFVREGLFVQSPLWYPEGWRRLAAFAAAFAVWTGVVRIFRRTSVIPATFAAMLAISCALIGPAPVAVVLLFLAAAVTVGRMLGAEDGGIALACGTGVYMFAAYWLVHWPVNHWITWLVLLVAPLAARARQTGPLLRNLLSATQGDSWLRVAIGFVLALHWVVALNPDVSSDGLAMHLAIPAKVQQLRYWPFDAGHTTWAVMAMGGDWCYMIVYLLGGEHAARLLNFALMIAAAALVYRVSRRWLDDSGALWIVLAYVSSPMVHLVTGNLFVETFWALLPFAALAALWRFEETGQRRALFQAAWLLGSAGMAKMGSLAFVAAIAPFGAWAVWKRRPRRPWIAGLLLAIPASIPYVIAYRVTGSPVYPFTAASPKRPGFDFLYELAFRTSRWLESQDGAFGFQYFALAPLVLLLNRRDWRFREWSALGVSLIFTLVIGWTQPNARYLYPVLAPLSVLIAIVLANTPAARPVLAVCVALNLWFLPTSSYSNKALVVDPRAAPVRKLVEWMNANRAGEPALFIGNPQIAGFQGLAFTNSWHNRPFLDRLSGANSDEALRSLFAQEKIRLFVAPVRGSGAFVDHIPLQAFLDRWTTEGPRNGGWCVALLADSPRSETEPEPLRRGLHDDSDPRIRYGGAWRRDTNFAETVNRTVAYDNERGAFARFTFEGSAFTWIHTRAGNRGRAAVSIDGGAPIEVDLHSAETQWRQRRTFRMPAGRHAVEIRILEDRYADIDAIEIE